MFRLQNHVPEVYPDKSRDFQLFCRLYDLCFSDVRFSAESMKRISDTKNCDAALLELLKTKLGLFTSIDIDTTELRYLLQAFPTLIRYKGSKQGLEFIKTLYTKMYNVSAPNFDLTYDYQLNVTFNVPPKNDKLLLELLRYVLPTGYIVSYSVNEIKDHRSFITTSDRLEYTSSSKESIFSTIGTVSGSSDINSSAPVDYIAEIGMTDINDVRKETQDD